MPLTEKFMVQNVDLLTRIEAVAKSINEDIAVVANIQEEQLATLEKIASGGIGAPAKKGEGGEGGKGGTKGEKGGTLKELAVMGGNIAKFAKSMATSIPSFIIVKPFMKRIISTISNFLVGISEIIEKTTKKISPKQWEKVSTIMGMFSGNISSFASQMTKSIPDFIILKPFIGIITSTIAKLVIGISKRITKKDADKAKTVAEMMNIMGTGILKFAGSMILAAPLLIAAIPGMLILKMTSGLIVSMVKKLGDNEKNIKKSTGSLNRISLSIVAFAGSIAVSALIMSTLGTEDIGPLAILFGSMSIAALTFAIIGKARKSIGKGALSMIAMSASIAIFALAYSFAAKQFTDVGFEGLGMTLLALVGVGGAFGIAGMFWSRIALGALAFGLVGLSLFLLAPSIATMAETLDKHPNAFWQIPLALAGIGAVFALAGILPVALAIGAGAIALGLAGGALWVIGEGIGAFMDAISGAPSDAGEKIESTLKGVINGFGKGFSDLSITEALTLPLKIPMVALMGGALVALGIGLKKYNQVAGDWSVEDTEQLSQTIGLLSQSFAEAGDLGEEVELGIETTMKMGKNLKTLAEGVFAWKSGGEAGFSTEMLMGKDKSGKTEGVLFNIRSVLNVIPALFAEMGAPEKASGSGFWFWERGNMDTGIASSMKVGKNLIELSKGVFAWKTGGEAGFTTKMLMGTGGEGKKDGIVFNIKRVLKTIPAAFADIGKKENKEKEEKRFWDFTNTDTKEGIRIVTEMAAPLGSVAFLMSTFKKIKDPEAHGKAVGRGVKGMLVSLSEGLLAIEDSEITRFERLIKPLKQLPSIFKDVNKEIEKHVKFLGNLPATYMENFDKWAGGMEKLSTIDTTSLQKNLEMSRKVSDIQPQTAFQTSAPAGIEEAGGKAITKPIPKETPNIVAKKAKGKTEQGIAIDQLLTAIQQLISVGGAQSTELQAIKQQLETGIRTFDGDPLG